MCQPHSPLLRIAKFKSESKLLRVIVIFQSTDPTLSILQQLHGLYFSGL